MEILDPYVADYKYIHVVVVVRVRLLAYLACREILMTALVQVLQEYKEQYQE